MGLINDFIDCLDKRWGEQAMQRQLDEKDRLIEERNRRIAEQDRALEALRIRKEELLRIREIRVRANVAWERAFAERTGGTIPTQRTPCSSDSVPKGQSQAG